MYQVIKKNTYSYLLLDGVANQIITVLVRVAITGRVHSIMITRTSLGVFSLILVFTLCVVVAALVVDMSGLYAHK